MVTRYLGNGLYSTGNRIYKESQKWHNGINFHKVSLITWSDRHCKKCGKFLPKKTQRNICHSCAVPNALRSFVYYHADQLNVGDYV